MKDKKTKTKVKTKTKTKVSRKEVEADLPQNIVPVGERVFEDKNIYIHQKVYNQIHKFAANKTENEHGGILVGRVVNEMGKENTIIEGFIEAKHNAATPTTLTFTHETWDYFHSEIDKKYKDKKIVGWIHTHPNFGIFLSENDRFIQENFFTDANQVAYVVDPIKEEEGFFFWIDEKLERCPGFYLFDKIGAKIKLTPWETEESEGDKVIVKQGKMNPAYAILLVLVIIVNLFTFVYQSNRITALERQVEDHKLVMQYGMGDLFYASMYAGMGPIDISQLAEQIRQQLQAAEIARKQQAVQEAAEKEKQQAEAGAEGTSETTEKTETENTNENGGQQ